MNNCVSSQKLEIYGSEVIKAAEILMNGFVNGDIRIEREISYKIHQKE